MGVSSCERYTARLEAAGVFFWLLKDMGWVLLLPEVSFPAALAAICLETHALLFRWGTDTAALKVHGVAVVLWLLGNSIWMTFEMLFYPSVGEGHDFPWYSGPIAAESESLYHIGCIWSSVLFGGALALLLGFYAQAALELRRRSHAVQMENPQDALEVDSDEDELIFGVVTPEVYQWVFIGPWILKDVFWNMEWLAPGLVCSAVVFALIIDYLRRFRLLLKVAEFLWVTGNTVWIVGELGLKDAAVWPRVAAASALLAGVAVSVVAFYLAPLPGYEDPRNGKEARDQHRPLIAGGAGDDAGSTGDAL